MLNLNKRYKVYKILFPNNKIYIGFTCNFKSRMQSHARDYKSNSQILVNRALRKYGFSNCTVRILFKSDNRRAALNKEIELIERLQARHSENGYNNRPGGDSKHHTGREFKNKLNLIGQKFGHLTVIQRSNKTYSSGSVVWQCLCDCGTEVYRAAIDLRSNKNKVKSCGCQTRQAIINMRTTHSASKTKEYYVWRRIRDCCSKVTHKDYLPGINVCERWQNSFENFLIDVGKKPSPAHKFTRLDKKKNYTPENTKWVIK